MVRYAPLQVIDGIGKWQKSLVAKCQIYGRRAMVSPVTEAQKRRSVDLALPGLNESNASRIAFQLTIKIRGRCAKGANSANRSYNSWTLIGGGKYTFTSNILC